MLRSNFAARTAGLHSGTRVHTDVLRSTIAPDNTLALSMPNEKLSDSDAKRILLGWPGRTKHWPPPGGSGYWIRAQPKVGSKPGPSLSSPGASLFHTQPDGMWAHFRGSECCDVVVIEVCGTAQNLNDKRSRYIPASHSVVVNCSLAWLREHISTKAGGTAARWEASRCFSEEPKGNIAVPVRHMRVLYALPDELYHKWCAELCQRAKSSSVRTPR